MKTIIVGRGRSKATQRMEISDPTVSREHCWLTDNGDGTYTLENKSPQGTFVDGRQIVKTRVTACTSIRLSPTTTVTVRDLIPLLQAPVARQRMLSSTQSQVPEYSISFLKKVWDDYHEGQLDIQREQKSINLMRSASPLFTMGSGAVATLSRTLGWGNAVFTLTIILTLIGLALMVYSFLKGVNDHSIEKKEALNETFQDRYVCPNPKCHHFLGNKPYSLLRQDRSCPWCKCKFTER